MQWEEQHGWQLAVIALALVMALVGSLLMIGPAPEAPTGVAAISGECRVEGNGVPFCACAPAKDGVYTAAHCFYDNPPLSALTVNGVPVPGYSVDPVRDLAHIPLFADPSVQYAAPSGEATWRGLRHGHATFRWAGETGGPWELRPGMVIHRQSWDRWCSAMPTSWHPTLPGVPRLTEGESRVWYGDSGAGFYDEAGRLVGILSLFDDGGCSAWTVRVP